MNAILLDGVSFTYAGAQQPALHGLSHRFPRGSATLLTGPSGCGKSTLLRLMNGLIPHVTSGNLEGKVEVDGLAVAEHDLAEAGRRTASIFQNPRNQFFAATVREELAFARQHAGEERATICRAVARAARLLGLEDWLERPLGAMSGGELQRVACGTALASPASIILLDEPTSNLSASAIEEVAAAIATLRRAGATVVIAEHRLYFLRDLVDTVLQMESGRIARTWRAGDFFALPAGPRTAAGLRTLHRPELRLAPTPAPPKPAGLRVENLRFSYGGAPAVAIPHLELPADTVTAIVGPNGAGKTTLCRLIVGLARPEKGSVLALDGLPTSRRQRLAASSFVMQDVHRQLFSASVREEVLTGTKSRAGADVEQILTQFGLAEVADRHPMSLSGGQKQRLVIASVLADNARVVVFDEPTSGVDGRHLARIATRIRELARCGRVVIVVSHDIEFVNACADRVLTLEAPTGGGNSRVTVRECLRTTA